MRKRKFGWLAVLLALSILGTMSGCKKEPVEAQPDQEFPEESSEQGTPSADTSGGINSLNTWISALESGDDVILSAEEIEQYNAQLVQDTATKCVDLAAYPQSLSKEELTALLDEAKVPEDERYVGSTKATDAYYAQLVKNLNQAGVKEDNPVRYGFAVENTVMRTFPTTDPSYEFADDVEFDLFAETMIKYWEPLLLLHTSADGKMVLAQSYNYLGWLPVESVAEATREEWEQYLSPERFLVVTGNKITLNVNVYHSQASERELFMGTRLPLAEEGSVSATVDGMTSESGRCVLLAESEGGKLVVRQGLVPWNADVSVGYLPYTQRNILTQAFKMLGDRHGWSGLNKSRDSSALVMDVYQTMGIHLPRNSSQQSLAPGEKTDLSALDDSEKTQEILKQPAGCLLFGDGHVALYLGQYEGKPYVLHSLYVAYDESGTEQMINAIVATDLSLYDKDGGSYLSGLKGAVVLK